MTCTGNDLHKQRTNTTGATLMLPQSIYAANNACAGHGVSMDGLLIILLQPNFVFTIGWRVGIELRRTLDGVA